MYLDWVYKAVGLLLDLLNSNFSSALFGAGFGALAANAIATRKERQERLREEINAVNGATVISIEILQTGISMRQQYILEMARTYRARFEDFVAITEGPGHRGGVQVYTLMADLRVLHMPNLPIDELKGIVQAAACSSAFSRALAGSLAQSAGALGVMVNLRNSMVADFPTLSDEGKVFFYFGLKTPDGFIDDRYPDSLEGMVSNSEDVIYFAELLLETLTQHGDKLAEQYGKDAPRITKVDLTEARKAGKLADRSRYPDFERQFRRPPGDIRLV